MVTIARSSLHVTAISDADPLATFGAAARALGRFGLAYLHLVLPAVLDATSIDRAILDEVRDGFASPVIVNGWPLASFT